MKNIKTIAILATFSSALLPQISSAQISGNVALTSDYVWRGVSQNLEDPAIQGGFDYAHDSGFYAGLWGSSVDFEGPESTEVDFYAGWSKEFENGLGVDVGVLEYTYFGGDNASDINFTEVYAGISYAGFGLTFYAGDEGDDNIELTYGYDFKSGVSLGATYGDFDTYTYFQAGISGEVGGIGLDLSFWDTDDLDGLEEADSRVVFTISKEF